MKDIISKIKESWEFQSHLNSGEADEINIPEKAKWLLINTETEEIIAITEKDLDSFKNDFDDDVTGSEVKKLKIGQSYDADGGINIYIRIKN